jgi:hypothetical protein
MHFPAFTCANALRRLRADEALTCIFPDSNKAALGGEVDLGDHGVAWPILVADFSRGFIVSARIAQTRPGPGMTAHLG